MHLYIKKGDFYYYLFTRIINSMLLKCEFIELYKILVTIIPIYQFT